MTKPLVWVFFFLLLPNLIFGFPIHSLSPFHSPISSSSSSSSPSSSSSISSPQMKHQTSLKSLEKRAEQPASGSMERFLFVTTLFSIPMFLSVPGLFANYLMDRNYFRGQIAKTYHRIDLDHQVEHEKIIEQQQLQLLANHQSDLQSLTKQPPSSSSSLEKQDQLIPDSS